MHTHVFSFSCSLYAQIQQALFSYGYNTYIPWPHTGSQAGNQLCDIHIHTNTQTHRYTHSLCTHKCTHTASFIFSIWIHTYLGHTLALQKGAYWGRFTHRTCTADTISLRRAIVACIASDACMCLCMYVCM